MNKTRVGMLLTILLALVMTAPDAEAKPPRDVRRAVRALGCTPAGPIRVAGPVNHGVICWTDLEHFRGKMLVLHYRHPNLAGRRWRGVIGDQGCLARRRHVFVVPAGERWYDCHLARRAAHQLDGRVVP